MSGPGIFAGLALMLAAASATPLSPPWIDQDAPLPAWVTSVRVLRGDEHVEMGPFHGSGRRGSVAREALLPVFATRRGSGCGGAWIEVGPLAWICGDVVELSGNPAI